MPKSRALRKCHEEAADWVLREQEGRLDVTGLSDRDAWLAAAPENRRAFEAAKRLMGDAGRAISSAPDLRDFDYRPRRAGPLIGALAALAIGGSLFLWFDGPMRLRADRIAATNELPVITLEDGSVMQLNASSAVAYDFTGNHRVVTLLRGQAYFEVAPDTARPFTVVAGEAQVTALGTAFDVRLGVGDLGVTVTEHAVRLQVEGADSLGTEIQEGELGIWVPQLRSVNVTPSDSTAALAWRQGQLVLDNAPLSYVVEEMGRHFGGKITITSQEVADRRVSGTLNIADTSSTIGFLEQALDVRVFWAGPVILITD